MATQSLILTIGDEHSILTYVVGKKVKNAWQTSEDPANAIKELREVFEKHQQATIYILVDTIEQTFSVDDLASSNYFQQKKIVERHVKVAFPGKNLRAYLPLGKADRGKKRYLLAAVPLNEKIESWLKVISKLPQTFGGVYSLPLESQSLTTKILNNKKKSSVQIGNTWDVLVTINITGGTRQIVSNNGQITLSRINKISSLNITQEDLVEGIYRDFAATLSYIRRLDYSDTDEINIIFIVSDEIKEFIHMKDWHTANVTVMSPSEAAEAANLVAVSGKEDYFCDMLHAAWFASKNKKYLRLISSEVSASDKSPLDPIKMLLPAGILVSLSMAGFSTYLHLRNLEAERALPALQAELSREETKHTQKKAELKKQPYSRNDMEDKIITYENLIKNSDQVKVAKIITRLDTAVNHHMADMNLELIELKIDAIAQETPPKTTITEDEKKKRAIGSRRTSRGNNNSQDNMVSQINDGISDIKENLSSRWKRVMRRKEATSGTKSRSVNEKVVSNASQIEINIDKGIKMEIVLQMPSNIVEPINAERTAGMAKEKLSRSFSDMSITELSTLSGYQPRKNTDMPYTCKFIIIGAI
jgi:hypothetical protein